MYEEEIEITRKKIKELANQFDLKYDRRLFKVALLKRAELVLVNFLTGCPTELYMKYGKSTEERVSKIAEFVNSKEFLKLVRKERGALINKRSFQKAVKMIGDEKIKGRYKEILKKLKGSRKGLIAVVSIPKKKSIFQEVLFHEWIHALLHSNRIIFHRLHPTYSSLDEGLASYLTASFLRKRQDVSSFIGKGLSKCRQDRYYQAVGKATLRFNNLLKNKTSPEKGSQPF